MKPEKPAPGSQASLREANLARVYEAVRHIGPMTQVEIAQSTGLSAASVSTLVRDLQAAGSLVLAPAVRNGRRATLVSLATGDLFAVAVFRDRELRVAVGNAVGEILAEQRLPLASGHQADDGMNRAALMLADLCEGLGRSAAELKAATVGLSAPVDSVSGQVGSVDVLRGWSGVAVAEEMSGRLQVPVKLDNDANIAALGELRSGSLQSVSEGCLIQAGFGVGAALVVGGRVYRGAAGTAGEIGHVTLDENGPVCRCGNRGCLDTFVGSRALVLALRATHGDMSVRALLDAAIAGDPGCRRVVEDAGRHLGVALASLVNLFNPQVVALSGELSRAGDLVVQAIRDALDRCAIPSAAATVELRLVDQSRRPELVGGLVLAAEQLTARV